MDLHGQRAMALGARVWLGVGSLLVLLVGSLLVAVFLIRGVTGHEERLNDRLVPYSSAVATATLNAKGVANDERGFLMSGDRKYTAEADRRIGMTRGWLDAAATTGPSPEHRRAVAAARAGFERWVAAVRREFAVYRAGDRTGAITASLGADRALRKSYEAALSRAQTLGAVAIRSADSSVAAASRRSIAILIGCLIVALAAGLGVGYWLVRSIAVPVARLLSILGRAERLTIVR